HLASVEERKIKGLVALLVETQMKKLEIKLRHFEELEAIMDKERESIEYQRQQLLQERQQFHMEQIRAAEYRARQFASQQLAENKTVSSQHNEGGPQVSTSASGSATAQNPSLAAAVQSTNYAMHGSPLPPQGPQVQVTQGSPTHTAPSSTSVTHQPAPSSAVPTLPPAASLPPSTAASSLSSVASSAAPAPSTSPALPAPNTALTQALQSSSPLSQTPPPTLTPSGTPTPQQQQQQLMPSATQQQHMLHPLQQQQQASLGQGYPVNNQYPSQQQGPTPPPQEALYHNSQIPQGGPQYPPFAPQTYHHPLGINQGVPPMQQPYPQQQTGHYQGYMSQPNQYPTHPGSHQGQFGPPPHMGMAQQGYSPYPGPPAPHYSSQPMQQYPGAYPQGAVQPPQGTPLPAVQRPPMSVGTPANTHPESQEQMMMSPSSTGSNK
ncbi:unnamed protein product, partial [Candidula unifasciata]